MVKYDVIYSCRHSATIALYGSYAERERKMEWFRRSGLCPDCYAEMKRKTNAELLSKLNLPKVAGVSEKQIAYAEKLRNNYIVEHQQEIELAKKIKINEGALDVAAQKLGKPLAEVLREVLYKHGIYKAYACINFISARDIIDALNN